MESIPKPTHISIATDPKDPTRGTLEISPLYPGYGPTIANGLRRVLLSSLPGAAISAFKIKGVSHEFTSIDYVKEDIVDISLNLKQINLKLHSNELVELTLSASGEKVLTAGDIKPNADVEIANPEQPIATLTDKAAQFEMTLWVQPGRGYETVESREKKDDLEVHAIAIDAIFSPIRQVGYQVDNVRVGASTDYDKVSMEIETNGTVSIEEAVTAASQLLADHFTLLSCYGTAPEPELDSKESTEDPAPADEEAE
jgi:DNA-directed RNA polymerase subunit alpha